MINASWAKAQRVPGSICSALSLWPLLMFVNLPFFIFAAFPAAHPMVHPSKIPYGVT